MITLLAYWMATTVYGVYWLIKNPRYGEDNEYFSLMEAMAKLFPAALLAWAIVPIFLMSLVRFKRN